MSTNSHIQINKALLRNFSHKEIDSKERRIHYLDLSSNVISTEKITKLGTCPDYYSEEIEEELSKIECKFGPIAKMFRDFGYKKDQIIISQQQKNDVIMYITYSILRSNLYYNSVINKASYTNIVCKIMRCNITHNDILSLVKINPASSPFRYYQLFLCDNICDTQFVIPRNCIYSISTANALPKLILPITPKRAIFLVDEQDAKKYQDEGNKKYFRISSNEVVSDMNYQAYLTEKMANNCFVAALRDKELEDIRAHIRNEYV